AFTQQFEKGYQTLATDYHLPLLKSLLEGVESDPTLFQADGLHPNAAAQPRIMQNVWRQLQAMLSKP
ncbi:MAG: acyl-CoA thioesterase I, partial [Halothiobacillaceae bacterium]